MQQTLSSSPEPEEVLALLKSSAIFKDVPEADLGLLAAGFVPRRISSGEIAVREGERGHEIFLVTEGAFDVFAAESEGRRQLGTLERGAIFGEFAALTGGLRYATVQASVDSSVLVNAESNFHEILRGSPPLTEAILRSLERYT